MDAESRNLTAADVAQGRQELVDSLDPASRQRLAALEGKRERILSAAREARAGEFELESARDALDRLLWIYLKLLVARHQLAATRTQADAAGLQQKAAELERALAAGGASASLRDSQTATLKILRQRLENLARCDESLPQVDSDLARVEAQLDLAVESTALRGGGAAVTANLELASQALGDGLDFGDSEAAVNALEQAYAAPPRPRERG